MLEPRTILPTFVKVWNRSDFFRSILFFLRENFLIWLAVLVEPFLLPLSLPLLPLSPR